MPPAPDCRSSQRLLSIPWEKADASSAPCSGSRRRLWLRRGPASPKGGRAARRGRRRRRSARRNRGRRSKRRGEEVTGGFAAHRAARDDEAEPLGILMLEAVVRVPGRFWRRRRRSPPRRRRRRVDAREDDARDVVVGGEFRDDLARQLLHARLGRVEDAVFHPAGIFCRGGGGGQPAGSDRVGVDDRVDLDAPLLAFVDEVAERVKKGEGALFAGEIGRSTAAPTSGRARHTREPLQRRRPL